MLSISVTDISGAWRAAVAAHAKRVERAELSAIKQATDLAKKLGRVSIASGGLSAKWQNALRSRVYPEAPAGFIWHKISWAWIFEHGGTIDGKPLLWLALPIIPLASGRSRRPLTPEQFTARFGPLVAFTPPGKKPMLFLKYQTRDGRTSKLSKGMRAGFGGVPLYVGLTSVHISKKFDIAGACRQASAQIPALYDAAMGTPG